jgi:L-ascorbate metabolism protein UlaG (beta-lactamase superfamily)
MHPLTDLAVSAGQVAVHWYEQASFAIKDSQGTIVLIDPYSPHNRPAERFIHAEPPMDESQLAANYVLLTHDHGDHTNPETIERLYQAYPEAQYVGPEESIKRILSSTPVPADHTRTIRAGDSLNLGAMTVHALYAKPPNGDPAADIKPPDVTHLGYVLAVEGLRLYFSGDPINTFPEHDELVEPVAALKPDLGFLTNHPSEGEFPFFAGCVKMAQRVGLKHAVPAHRACFVKRDYDPNEWAAQFPEGEPEPLIIPRNSYIIYPL